MTNSLAQGRRLAAAAGETPMPALNRRYFGEEYFCPCFVCGASWVCSHREPELIVWWLGLQRTEVPARTPVKTKRNRTETPKGSTAAPSVVPIHTPNRPEASKREVSPRSFRMDSEYSGLRGW